MLWGQGFDVAGMSFPFYFHVSDENMSHWKARVCMKAARAADRCATGLTQKVKCQGALKAADQPVWSCYPHAYICVT